MIIKTNVHKITHLLVIPLILIGFLIFNYKTYTKTFPISFYDEIMWVGDSYFFDFFIHGDFTNSIWQSSESYDQPKLAEYAYGAWLYPLYLKEKKENLQLYDYTQFLIKNGFYEVDEEYMDSYKVYKNNHLYIKYDEKMVGSPEDWMVKYGQNGLNAANLIQYARILNIYLLSGAVIFAYFFAYIHGGILLAVISSLVYAFNPLIVTASLQAHSEALYLFNFNGALLFMSLFFLKGRKIYYLLLFSLFAGLCSSTKLNGSLLIIVFFILNAVTSIVSRKISIKNTLLNLVPLVTALSIVILLNPFTYSNIISKTMYLFQHRQNAAMYAAKEFPESYLEPGLPRITRIFQNYFYSEKISNYNGNIVFDNFSYDHIYGIFLFTLVLLGSFVFIRNAYKKNLNSILFLYSFISILLVTLSYLCLDWPRYYAHLTLFIIIFQMSGLLYVIQKIYRFSILRLKLIINK